MKTYTTIICIILLLTAIGVGLGLLGPGWSTTPVGQIVWITYIIVTGIVAYVMWRRV